VLGFRANEGVPEGNDIVHTSCGETVLIVDVESDHVFQVISLGLLELDIVPAPVDLGFHKEGYSALPTCCNEPEVAAVTKESQF
jgi:hypothetical protein